MRLGAMALSLLISGFVLSQLGDQYLLPETDLTVVSVTIPQQGISFPIEVSGTDLVAEKIICYEGPFIEDGSDEPVTDVLAVVLKNNGTQRIVGGEVILERGGEQLLFRFSQLLPGMRVAVLEQGRAHFIQDGYTAVSGWTQSLAASDDPLLGLTLTQVDMGSVLVTNTSGKTLEDVVLYHKNWFPDDTYVGGLVYETRLQVLEPGDTVTVKPDHYAWGYSVIYMAD